MTALLPTVRAGLAGRRTPVFFQPVRGFHGMGGRQRSSRLHAALQIGLAPASCLRVPKPGQCGPGSPEHAGTSCLGTYVPSTDPGAQFPGSANKCGPHQTGMFNFTHHAVSDVQTGRGDLPGIRWIGAVCSPLVMPPSNSPPNAAGLAEHPTLCPPVRDLSGGFDCVVLGNQAPANGVGVPPLQCDAGAHWRYRATIAAAWASCTNCWPGCPPTRRGWQGWW